MKDLDANYWEERYQQNQTGWDIGHCSTPLKEYFDQIEDKTIKILIPGAGFGHEVKYLHDLGFTNVFVVDVAQKPLDHLQEVCPNYSKNQLLLEDFFEHQGSYDLIIEQTFFCALDPSLREEYTIKMKNLLKPKGKLVGVLFNRDFEGGPPFGGCLTDYKVLFENYFENVYIEPCYNSIEPRKGSEVFVKIS